VSADGPGNPKIQNIQRCVIVRPMAEQAPLIETQPAAPNAQQTASGEAPAVKVKGKHGGPRPGSGRPKGSVNFNSQSIAKAIMAAEAQRRLRLDVEPSTPEPAEADKLRRLPPKSQRRGLVESYISLADWKRMMRALVREALRGDLDAIKLCISYVDGQPVARTELTGKDGEALFDPADNLVERLSAQAAAAAGKDVSPEQHVN
jgi:hypothetical protein